MKNKLGLLILLGAQSILCDEYYLLTVEQRLNNEHHEQIVREFDINITTEDKTGVVLEKNTEYFMQDGNKGYKKKSKIIRNVKQRVQDIKKDLLQWDTDLAPLTAQGKRKTHLHATLSEDTLKLGFSKITSTTRQGAKSNINLNKTVELTGNGPWLNKGNYDDFETPDITNFTTPDIPGFIFLYAEKMKEQWSDRKKTLKARLVKRITQRDEYGEW